MTPGWIDTHVHLTDPKLADHDRVIRQAAEAGLVAMILVAIDGPTSEQALALSARFPGVYPTVGIHPNHCAEAAAQDFDRIAELAQDPAVVAIGETGLDTYWKYAPLELQKEFLRRHLHLARTVNKPIILHNRDANGPLLEELSRAAADGPLRGVMHSFCADAATAEAGLQLGLYLSFSGMLTYKANQSLRDLVSLLPRDRLLIETDAPYLAPEPHRGKTNEPAWVVPVGVKLAQCLGISPDQAARLTTENARRCFGIDAFAPTLGSSALL